MSDTLIFDLPNVSGNQTIDCSASTLVSGSITSAVSITVTFSNVKVGTVIFFTFVNTSASTLTIRIFSPQYSCKGVVGISAPVDLTASGAPVPTGTGFCAIGNTCTIGGVPFLVFNA